MAALSLGIALLAMVAGAVWLAQPPDIAQAQGADGVCRAGLAVAPGESCTYPGTSVEFAVDSSGRGRFLFVSAGTGISALGTTINGVTYHFKAARQADGSWLIEVAGDPAPAATHTATPTPADAGDANGALEGASVEGRIEARRLDDGRVEFAFRPEGEERILPRARFFPANARVDRWLVSSEVAADGEVLGRITARLRDDGRIEFGFNPAEGERILPRARFFPATAQVDRWLRSTVIELPRALRLNGDAPPEQPGEADRPARPDLVVEAFSVDETNPDPGELLSVEASVRNRGGSESPSSRVRFYWSSDATITTADTELADRYVFRLDPSESDDSSALVRAPSSYGTYYFGACVDAVDGESDTANNCSEAIAVTAHPPDLVVDAFSVDETNPDPGELLSVEASVRNRGGSESPSSRVRFYWSSDATITTADTQLADRYVFRLDPSESDDSSALVWAPSSYGTYYFGACVDEVDGESDTANNCSSATRVTVRSSPTGETTAPGGDAQSGGSCRAGMTLDEGDSCTVVIPGINVGTDRFEVRDGRGCYGGICSGSALNLSGFRASRSGATWTVESVP